MKFFICKSEGSVCSCNFEDENSSTFKRRHVNHLGLFQKKTSKLKKFKYCKNPLHKEILNEKVGTYHFLADERPTWLFHCNLPSNSESENRKIAQICEKLGIKCVCVGGNKLCVTCENIINNRQLFYKGNVYKLTPLLLLMPLFDFESPTPVQSDVNSSLEQTFKNGKRVTHGV